MVEFNKPNKQNKQIKVDPIFAKELDDIQKKRIKNDKDDRPCGDRLLTKKIPKSKFWQAMKEELITNDFIPE